LREEFNTARWAKSLSRRSTMAATAAGAEATDLNGLPQR
jgi:hypothetical protein